MAPKRRSKTVVPINGMALTEIPGLTEAQADLVEGIDAGYQERLKRQSERISVMVEWMVSEGLLPQFNAWEEKQRGN